MNNAYAPGFHPYNTPAMPPPPRIRIAGLGLVSPLGIGAWPTFRAMLAGKTLGSRATKLPTDLDPVTFCQQLGRVGVACHAGDDPAVELAERAAREAAMDAGIDLTDVRCCIGTSKGAVTAMAHDKQPIAVALGAHGYLTQRLREKLHLGLTEHYVAACASSLTALHHARLKMRRPNGPRVMLVVTSEAALLPIFIHSYRRLGVLAPMTRAGYATGPLDESRQGFMLSELAAAVVLERTDNEASGGIELVDTAIACDAHDLIRTDPAMPALRHVASQLLTEPMIMHPHATGTRDHDPFEMQAVADGKWQMADVYACKGALGHGLGASGLVSLIIAALCARTNKRPPMPWLHRPLHPSALCHPPSTISPSLPHAVFAAGFAGHVAGAVIRKV